MLKLPIYLRGSSYYLHTRINGKQVKRSLGTIDRLTAMIRACQLLNSSRMDNSKLLPVSSTLTLTGLGSMRLTSLKVFSSQTGQTTMPVCLRL